MSYQFLQANVAQFPLYRAQGSQGWDQSRPLRGSQLLAAEDLRAALEYAVFGGGYARQCDLPRSEPYGVYCRPNHVRISSWRALLLIGVLTVVIEYAQRGIGRIVGQGAHGDDHR